MQMKIALAGNPNSGKTMMFNALTGSSQYVGNWPGVTVEKKEGLLKTDKKVTLQDLPGIYSLSPYTQEEVITRNYLINDRPDAVIDLVDASNLERNLYLTTQLMELDLPVVVALNMIDIVKKRGDKIDIKKLSDELGLPIVETSALKKTGLDEIAARAIEAVKSAEKPKKAVHFSPEVEAAVAAITELLPEAVRENEKRWFGIKLFERDAKAIDSLSLDHETKDAVEDIIRAAEKRLNDDSESIIINERYVYIQGIIKGCLVKSKKKTTSEKVDAVLTNRWAALPIFAAIMFLIYYISVTTIGGMATDWVNDTLFGEIVPGAVESLLDKIGTAEWVHSLVINGIIGGVGSVLGFVPQLLVLFFLLAFLEDSGYMARIAFIMDRIFRKFGLSGKSFIPILIGAGCSVPGIMAARTIENESDRRMTAITTSFMPCSAKLPVIALIAGALFAEAWWVAPSAYFVGIAAIVISGIILKKTKMFAGDVSPFVMELPEYHLPSLRIILKHTWDRGKSFVKKAGTVIFISAIIIWFLSNFSWGMKMVPEGESMLASIGKVFAAIFAPLGWGRDNWQAAVATLSGLVAKENLVSTFGVLYGYAEVAEDGKEIWSQLQASLSMLSAYSLLLFNLLCAPCFAAIGAIRREMNSGKWTAFAILYQTLLAYFVSFSVFQIGSIFNGVFGVGSVIAIVLVLGFLYLLFRPNRYKKTLKPLKEGI